jgi:hypothetical protein
MMHCRAEPAELLAAVRRGRARGMAPGKHAHYLSAIEYAKKVRRCRTAARSAGTACCRVTGCGTRAGVPQGSRLL